MKRNIKYILYEIMKQEIRIFLLNFPVIILDYIKRGLYIFNLWKKKQKIENNILIFI